MPYTDSINSLLERFYDSYIAGNRSQPIMRTPKIIRYIDDKPQDYDINFQTNVQEHVITKYRRAISRVQVKIPKSNGKWCVNDDDGNWTYFDTTVQGILEQHFQSYAQGKGPSSISVTFPGRPETYHIDFANGVQTNQITSRQRSIKRI
jgi:hypothetical protein